MTFNYRYSPRNSSLKEVIASGRDRDGHLDPLRVGAGHCARRRLLPPLAPLARTCPAVCSCTSRPTTSTWSTGGSTTPPTGSTPAAGCAFYGDAGLGAAAGGPPARARHRARSRGTGGRSTCAEDERLKRLYLDAEHHDGYLRDQDVFEPRHHDRGQPRARRRLPRRRDDDRTRSTRTRRGRATGSRSTAPRAGPSSRCRARVGRAGRARGSAVLDPSARDGGRASTCCGPPASGWSCSVTGSAPQEVDIPMGEGSHGGGDAILLGDVFRGRDRGGPAGPPGRLRRRRPRGGGRRRRQRVAAHRTGRRRRRARARGGRPQAVGGASAAAARRAGRGRAVRSRDGTARPRATRDGRPAAGPAVHAVRTSAARAAHRHQCSTSRTTTCRPTSSVRHSTRSAGMGAGSGAVRIASSTRMNPPDSASGLSSGTRRVGHVVEQVRQEPPARAGHGAPAPRAVDLDDVGLVPERDPPGRAVHVHQRLGLLRRAQGQPQHDGKLPPAVRGAETDGGRVVGLDVVARGRARPPATSTSSARLAPVMRSATVTACASGLVTTPSTTSTPSSRRRPAHRARS